MAMDNSNDGSSNSGIALPSQLGPIGALPGDIILELFQYLDQQDCLRCMAVCRYWYSVVPGYTQNLWKEIRLNVNWIAEKNVRRERCLGRHVKKLVIEPPEGDYHMERTVEEKELHTLIQGSLALGCTEVESIELICCVTNHFHMFLDLVKLLLPRVKRLAMTDHLSYLPIMDVLYSFPELTHFTCRYSPSSSNPRLTFNAPLNTPIDYHTKLTHLWLEVDIPKRQKELILQICPDLICYIDTTRNVPLEFNAVELDQVFTWCPKIMFLEANSLDHHWQSDDYVCGQAGLRYLNVNGGFEVDQLSRQMTRNQGTLEFLYICNYQLNDLMPSLHLQNLRTLICFGIQLSAENLAMLPDHCPGLETFDLYSASRLRLDSIFVQSLSAMHRLKSLSMRGVALDDDVSLLTVLERFPILERLVLHRMTLSIKLPDGFKCPSHLKHLELPDALFFGNNSSGQGREAEIAYFLRHLTCNSKLENIQLPHVPRIGQKTLLMIATISTLKLLEVHLDYTLKEEELVEFIMMLRGTAVDTLTLGHVFSLTFTMLSALAELPHLKILCTEGSGSNNSITRISRAGLQQILWTSPKLSRISLVGDIMLEESKNVLTRNQIRSLVRQLTPDADQNTWPPFRRWRVRIDDTPSVRRVIFSSIPTAF